MAAPLMLGALSLLWPLLLAALGANAYKLPSHALPARSAGLLPRLRTDMTPCPIPTAGLVAMHRSMQSSSEEDSTFKLNAWTHAMLHGWECMLSWQRTLRQTLTTSLASDSYVHCPLPLPGAEDGVAMQWSRRMEAWRGWRTEQHQAAGSAWHDSASGWLSLPLLSPRVSSQQHNPATVADNTGAAAAWGSDAAVCPDADASGWEVEEFEAAVSLAVPETPSPAVALPTPGPSSSRRSSTVAAPSPPDYYYLRPNRMVLKSPLKHAGSGYRGSSSPLAGCTGSAADHDAQPRASPAGGGVQFRWLRRRVVWVYADGVPAELGKPIWL